MPAHHPYRAETTGWGASFALSLLLHAAVLGSLAAWAWYLNRSFQMGDPQAKLGGAVGVNVVETIPIPQRPAPERKMAARDTENEVLEKPEPKKAEPRNDDGIALLKKKKKKPEKKIDLAKLAEKRLLPEEKLPSRLTSDLGSRARSKIYEVRGMGDVGVGDNSPFGAGLGWYATLLQKKLGEKWSAEEVPRLSSRGRTVVSFTIFRNGKIANGKVLESSGNPAADRAALRAVEAISPFVALPGSFPRDAAFVEFYFDLKK